MHRLTPVVLVFVLLLAGCQGSDPTSNYAPKGYVQPTVAGRSPATFCGLEEARAAFTRSCGSLTAALEDSAWLRFKGDPQCVEQEHRAYFELGYTTFLVELRSKGFTQPTKEGFVLQDSQGACLNGSPITYEGSPVLVDDRYYSTFSLSFRHILSRDIQWIRLTRVADRSTVEWSFVPPPEPCADPCPTPCPPPCGVPGGR